MAKDGCTEDVRNQPSFTKCRYSGVPDDGYHTFRKKDICYRRETVLEKQLALTFHEDFANEGKLLKEKLTAWHGLEVVSEASVTIVLDYLSDRKKGSQ